MVRRSLQLLQNDYEDIVKEIEGDLNDLQWRGAIIKIPTFPEEVSNVHCFCNFVGLLSAEQNQFLIRMFVCRPTCQSAWSAC